jgi:hypothetical protein
MSNKIHEYTFKELDFLKVLDADGECIGYQELEVDAELQQENDGIGHYEYCGSAGYDQGTDYWSVVRVTWNRDLYTEQENATIDRWIETSWSDIEQEIVDDMGGVIW